MRNRSFTLKITITREIKPNYTKLTRSTLIKNAITLNCSRGGILTDEGASFRLFQSITEITFQT